MEILEDVTDYLCLKSITVIKDGLSAIMQLKKLSEDILRLMRVIYSEKIRLFFEDYC